MGDDDRVVRLFPDVEPDAQGRLREAYAQYSTHDLVNPVRVLLGDDRRIYMSVDQLDINEYNQVDTATGRAVKDLGHLAELSPQRALRLGEDLAQMARRAIRQQVAAAGECYVYPCSSTGRRVRAESPAVIVERAGAFVRLQPCDFTWRPRTPKGWPELDWDGTWFDERTGVPRDQLGQGRKRRHWRMRV